MAHPPGTPNPARGGRDTATIKRESPGLNGEQAENFGEPGVFGHEGAMVGDVDIAEDEETVRAEMAVVEAEVRLARLRHKAAIMAKK